MFKLEKNITLYRQQYEEFMMDVYGSYRIDRISMDLDAVLFRVKYMERHGINTDKMKPLFKQHVYDLKTVFADYAYKLLKHKLVDIASIDDIMVNDVKLDQNYVKFQLSVLSEDEDYLEWVDGMIPDEKPLNIFPEKYFRFFTDSYNDGIAKAYPELFQNRQQDVIGTGADKDIFVHSLTFQTTERCSLSCTYCYQFAKSEMQMSFDTAKEFIDKLLNDEYGYINRYNSPAIIIEFIGGEPLLEINRTREIYEYFLDRCYELNHPWFTMHRLSICSNGMQYFNDNVQDFFKTYASQISFNISIDGNKELHDACRKQPNGEGSYDIDMMALNHFATHYSSERNSKMTLAPSNIEYLFDSVVDFINHGMTVINLNCVFEEGWQPKHAKIEYEQLKKLSDYLLDNDLEHLYIGIFNERQEDMMDKDNDSSFCFRGDSMVLTEHGNKQIKDLQVGDIVYDQFGYKNKVRVMHTYFSEDNVKFKASGIFETHCTSDHKVFAKKFLYMGFKGKIHYSEPGYYPISELRVGDRIALPLLDLSKNKDNWITKDIAYALGVFLADGTITHKYGKSTNRIVITPGYDKDGYYRNILKKADLVFTEFSGETSMRYIISRYKCRVNEAFYKLCEQCGHLAINKHVPKIIFESKPEIVSEVIRGYTDTDGYISKSGVINVNSISKKLITDIMILLRSLGQYPTCYYCKREGLSTIEGRTVHIHDRYEMYYNPDKSNARNMFKRDDELNVLWSGIHSMSKDESYQVYCPTVYPINDGDPETHSIIVNGLGVLNCGGQGSMLALRPNGEFYPCIRYMPTSVGPDRDSYCIGTVHDGMDSREDNSPVLNRLDHISRRGQTNDICYECPLSNDCASCLALGLTVFNNPNKRTTFSCIMVIAEALANVYYWNLVAIKHPEWHMKPRHNVVPKEWALLVIDEQELQYLYMLELSASIQYYEK